MKESYQFSLKSSKKLARKSQLKSWEPFKIQGLVRGKGNPVEASSYSLMELINRSSEDRGQWTYTKGQGGGKGF